MTIVGKKNSYGNNTISVIREVYQRFQNMEPEPRVSDIDATTWDSGDRLIFLLRNIETLLDIAEGQQEKLAVPPRVEVREYPTGKFEATCYGQLHTLRADTKDKALVEAYLRLPVWVDWWVGQARKDLLEVMPKEVRVLNRFDLIGEDT